MAAHLITCSYATCAIPEAQREIFRGQEELLTSEKGWEPGALNLAQGLAMKLSSPLIHGEVSRLLIDLEMTGEERWSEFTKKIPQPARSRVTDRIVNKFEHQIENRLVEDLRRNDSIIHFLIHTAPIEDGKIIFEHGPSKPSAPLAKAIIAKLPMDEILTELRATDPRSALINWVGSLTPPNCYHPLRIVVSQSFFLNSTPMRWDTLKKALITATSAATLAAEI